MLKNSDFIEAVAEVLRDEGYRAFIVTENQIGFTRIRPGIDSYSVYVKIVDENIQICDCGATGVSHVRATLSLSDPKCFNEMFKVIDRFY